jgi:anti-sigma factor RsiW
MHPLPIHPSDAQLNDYVDGAMDASDLAAVASHLEQCAACALFVAQLQHIMRDAQALPPLHPPPAVWERISAELKTPDWTRQEERAATVPVTRRAVGPVYWALATAAAVVMAFLGGRAIEQRHQRDAVTQAAARTDRAGRDAIDTVNALSNTRERVLLVAVGDHLDRSQMVLVELANAQTHGKLDISAERQSADELLASNRLYRQTAVQLGQANVADVLDDLERVLVEVARGPSQVSMPQLADIQQRIEAQGILFKVKIVNATIAGRKAPVS